MRYLSIASLFLVLTASRMRAGEAAQSVLEADATAAIAVSALAAGQAPCGELFPECAPCEEECPDWPTGVACDLLDVASQIENTNVYIETPTGQLRPILIERDRDDIREAIAKTLEKLSRQKGRRDQVQKILAENRSTNDTALRAIERIVSALPEFTPPKPECTSQSSTLLSLCIQSLSCKTCPSECKPQPSTLQRGLSDVVRSRLLCDLNNEKCLEARWKLINLLIMGTESDAGANGGDHCGLHAVIKALVVEVNCRKEQIAQGDVQEYTIRLLLRAIEGIGELAHPYEAPTPSTSIQPYNLY